MRVRALVGALGELLVTAGAVLLLFVTWQLWWTDVAANHAQSGTVTALEQDFGRSHLRGATGRNPVVAPPSVDAGEAFAIVRIPRFGADWERPIIEGTDHDVLQQGVGHYPGTALPGRVGNFSIAGHRTTYGRPFHDIDRLRDGDRVIVETKAGYAVYAVRSREIVLPFENQVIAAVPSEPGARPTQAWLTMTSCHPKYSAAERYVVHARLEGTYSRADGLPPVLLSLSGAA